MLLPSSCYVRKCIHYLGIKQDDGTEMTEVNYCKAYPKGIPDQIAYGEFSHDEIYPGQNGDFVYKSKL